MRKINQTIYGDLLPWLLMKQGMDLLSKNKNKYEKYVYDTVSALGEVTRSEEKIQLSILYLEINKSIASTSYNLTKNQLVEYAIEGFIVRSTSVFDRILQLINAILELKIYKKNVNFVVINGRIRRKFPELSLALMNVKKVTSKYLNHRNGIIHESVYSDIELVRMQLISDHINADLQRDISPVFDSHELDIDLNKYIEIRSVEFRAHAKNIEIAVDEITNLLEPIFKEKFSRISNYSYKF